MINQSKWKSTVKNRDILFSNTYFFSRHSTYSFFFLLLSCAEIWVEQEKNTVIFEFLYCSLSLLIPPTQQLLSTRRLPYFWSSVELSSVPSLRSLSEEVCWGQDNLQRPGSSSLHPSAWGARTPAASAQSNKHYISRPTTTINHLLTFRAQRYLSSFKLNLRVNNSLAFWLFFFFISPESALCYCTGAQWNCSSNWVWQTK